MKKGISIVLFMVIAICMSSFSFGQDATDWSSMNNFLTDLGISRDDLDTIKDKIDDRALPIINYVTVTPENPGENEDINVTAEIVTLHKPIGDEIWEAYIYYSADGGKTVEKVEMEKPNENRGIWHGTIPGQPSGTELVYGIQAINTYGGTYIEALCEAEGAMVTPVPEDAAGCKGEDIPEFCNAKNYSGCAVPMSVSSDRFGDFADSPKDIKDELYIKSTRAGLDEKDIVLQMNTKGKVSGGSFSPTDVNIYVAGWLNPDKAGSEIGIDAILKQGAIIIFAPLNISNKCALYYVYGVDVQSDNSVVTCTMVEDHAVLKFVRKAKEPNPSNTLEFLFMTLSMANISPPDVKLRDLTMFTKVNFNRRRISIQ